MIVCHCRVVSDRDVDAAVRGGARNLSQVCRSTGAGQDCGTCIFSVKQLVCQHEGSAALLLAASSAAMEADLAAS
ncbi:MAG TPA: (2Fe-2S)-binding protein [Nocardioidaceae bacterium]|nr:(2Fe-2S)-binding protein [Nocardioidaceae bacterium]